MAVPVADPMQACEINDDKTLAAESITMLLKRVRLEGQRVLVVIGAGCSYAAGMPLMKDVYAYLHARLKESEDGDVNLEQLRKWLAVLKEDAGPRSLAARALGLFQQPHLAGARARAELQSIWQKFAADFLCWQVAPYRKPNGARATILSAEPTKFHKIIASWVWGNAAVVLSLNFDGLTRKAVEQSEIVASDRERCVILARREEIDRYFFAEASRYNGKRQSRLFAVIKARGDVFHATCRNELCPACHKPAAIYDLQRQLERQNELAAFDRRARLAEEAGEQRKAVHRQTDELEANAILTCSDCGALRQLEISFAGYQRKEEEAEDLLDGLRERVLPGIGGVITVGVSGLWDDALVEMLECLGRTWKGEDKASRRRIICIDQRQDVKPFLVQRLERADIEIVYAPIRRAPH